MKLPFTKMHGLGNDFVVVDDCSVPFRPTPAQARLLADRRFGVGCDQILVVERAAQPGADFDYRIYNSDGSESGQCLNGARCVARFIHDRGLSRDGRFRLRTRTTRLGRGIRPPTSRCCVTFAIRRVVWQRWRRPERCRIRGDERYLPSRGAIV